MRYGCFVGWFAGWAIALCSLGLGGCQVSDSHAKVTALGEASLGVSEFVLMGDREIEAELTAACAERGITIRPIAVRQLITEKESADRQVAYNELGTRFALNIALRHNYAKVCVFSGNHFVDASVTVIDAQKNETRLIIRQEGPLGDCPPLTPVWELIADELKKKL